MPAHRDIGVIVYRRDSVHGNTCYNMYSEPEAFKTDFPDVHEKLLNLDWEEYAPGKVKKDLYVDGVKYQTYEFFCQDCGIDALDYDMFMLHNELWYKLYPDNGVACPECAEKRLGRKLQPSDLIPGVPVNDWFIEERWK